ncbi:hypothetical protein L218DRAFT_481825 [Marasmius fiardii PR-910]|nr:hypothetical protein L218DRAFT_481825 [Marasmius fiardii PR-910]
MPSTSHQDTLAVRTNLGRYTPFSKRGSGFDSPGAGNGNWRARGDSSSNASSSPPSSPSSPTHAALPATFTSGHGSHRSAGKYSSICFIRTTGAKYHDLVSNHKLPTLPVYTINDMLLLQKSPLARMSPETREAIKENVPEIVLSRKQRHNMKRNGQGHRPNATQNRHHNSQPTAPEQPLPMIIPAVSSPSTTVLPLRRDQSRLRMKRRGSKSIVDEISWRRAQRSRTNAILGAPIVAQ